MDFVEGKCPKCQGILQLPADHKSVICMYCAEDINIPDATVQSNKHSGSDNVSYLENCRTAMNGVSGFISDLDSSIVNFKKATYETAFMSKYEMHKPVLKAIENAYLLSEDQQLFLTQIGEKIVSNAIEDIKTQTRKRGSEQKLMDYNVVLAVYTIPMILEYKKESSTLLADKILELWKNEFPKTNLQKAQFDEINSGFRKRLCYITSAVCEVLKKSDDCYELKLLRSYRDNYLVHQPDGEELINKYYDIAPTIIKRIKKQPQSEEIFMRIWEEYLSPCIQYIENGQNSECRKIYMKMVNDLQDTYVLHSAYNR